MQIIPPQDAPFKIQNYLLMTEAVIEHILSSVVSLSALE